MHSYVCVALKSRKHASLVKRESLMETRGDIASYVRGNTHTLGYVCGKRDTRENTMYHYDIG